MNEVYKAIFRAIHEGKWLQIEYQNKAEKMTRFWIGILNLDVRKRTLSVDGLHIVQMSLEKYGCLYIDSIRSAKVIEGSYQAQNDKLIQDIKYQPEKYEGLFGNAANLKILNYLAECNRLDTVPYYTNYDLLLSNDEGRVETFNKYLSDEKNVEQFLRGKEHMEEETVKARDQKKNQICREHNFELIRVDNTYARRYYHVKNILIDYFEKINGR